MMFRGLLIALLLGSSGWANASPIFSVVLDPGHGGQDVGVQQGSLLEKRLTLEVAQKIQKIFENRTDLRVILTRKDDYEISLRDRKNVANVNAPGIYVSLHFGKANQTDLQGARVYVLAAPKVTGKSALTKLEEAHGTYLTEAWKLATVLSRGLASHHEEYEPARIAPLPLAPLLGVTLPSVLIELDYLTAADASRWADPHTSTQMAISIAASIDRYLKVDSSLDRSQTRSNNPTP